MKDAETAAARWFAMQQYWPRLVAQDQELLVELAQRLHDNPSESWEAEEQPECHG